jgi:hypothetical protein
MALEDESSPSVERPDVDTRAILVTALVFVLVVAASLAGLAMYYRGSLSSAPSRAAAEFPEPRVGANELEQRLRLEADQRARLAGYEDRAGTRPVHLSIEQAMTIIAARGSAAYDPIQQPGTGARP